MGELGYEGERLLLHSKTKISMASMSNFRDEMGAIVGLESINKGVFS